MQQSFLDTDVGKAEFALLRDQEHIDYVWSVMEPIASDYIDRFLGCVSRVKGCYSPQDGIVAFIKGLIDSNDKLHDKYHKLFSMDVMEEYGEDTEGFKSAILKKECDVIRKTLQSRSEALNEWKSRFYSAKSQSLFDSFYNMMTFAEEYSQEMTEEAISALDSVEECRLSEMEEDACYQAGVLGYGIVSNILNHMYPRVFPGNYKAGVWSLYFLSNGTRTIVTPTRTSEFSMVKDETWSKTGIYEMEHNYFFPYEVFCIYALRLYRKLTQRIATKYNKEFPSEYRFLLTNSFFDFVTSENKESITTLAGNDDVLKFNTPW